MDCNEWKFAEASQVGESFLHARRNDEPEIVLCPNIDVLSPWLF